MNQFCIPGGFSLEDILICPLELLFLPLTYWVSLCCGCFGFYHEEAAVQYKRRQAEARAHYGTAPTPEPAMTRAAPAARPPTRPEVQIFAATVPSAPAPAPTATNGANTSLGAGAPPPAQAPAEAWIVRRVDLQLGDELGGGSFGRVFAARWHGTVVAVKVFKPEGGSAAEAAAFTAVLLPKIRAEAALLAALRHPNVVTFYGVLEGGAAEPPCVVTELCVRGLLLDVLHAGKAGAAAAAELTWRRLLGLVLDAAAGVLHLHEQALPVLQRDLKIPNLLVTADWRCKVSDLGLSKLMDDAAATTTAGGAGNPHWTAPEVLQGGRAAHVGAALGAPHRRARLRGAPSSLAAAAFRACCAHFFAICGTEELTSPPCFARRSARASLAGSGRQCPRTPRSPAPEPPPLPASTRTSLSCGAAGRRRPPTARPLPTRSSCSAACRTRAERREIFGL